MVIQMMVLDTSFLISLFLPEDENHSKALEIFEKRSNEEMLLIDTILFETLSVLNRRHGVEAAKAAYEKLIANTKLQIHYLTDVQRKEVLENFLSQKGRLSTADMSVVHACKTALAPPLAFDKELLKQIG